MQQQKQRNQRGANTPDRQNLGKQPKLNRKGELALTLAQLSQVRVNMPPGFAESGTALVMVFRATGVEIGLTQQPPKLLPLDDLNRLFSARRTIAGVEAQEKKVSNMTLQKRVLMRGVVSGEIADLSKVPVKFSTELTRLAAAHQFIDDHIEVIKSVHDQGMNKQYKNFLLSQIDLINRVTEDYLKSLAKGDDTHTHKDLLRKRGVSEWLYNKLVATTIAITSTMALETFFFPLKAEKGLAFTIKEWREPALMGAHNLFLGRSEILMEILFSDQLGDLLSQMKVDLNDETNNETKKILRQVVYVIPTINVKDYALSHKDVLRPTGEQTVLSMLTAELFSLISGAFPLEFSPKEAMKKFFNIDASASITKTLREDFLEKLPRDAKSALDVEKTLNEFALSKSKRFPMLKGSVKDLVMKPDQYGDTPKVVPPNIFAPLNDKERREFEDPKWESYKSALDVRYSVKRRSARDATSKSLLTREGQALIAALEQDPDYRNLIGEILSFLTSFSSKEMQASAATIMHAEFNKKTVLLEDKAQDLEFEEEETEKIGF